MPIPIAAVLPFVGGLLAAGSSIWGQDKANKDNVRQSREQMQFQERMSGTAAQRSVKDYLAAGLNPALAYDRPASSPGGASAVIGNVMDGAVNQGLSTARAARDWKADTEAKKLGNSRSTAEIEALRVAKATSMAQGDVATETARKIQQERVFGLEMQPHLMRAQALQNLLTAASIPGAQNQAKFDSRMGEWSPGLKMLLNSAGQMRRIVP